MEYQPYRPSTFASSYDTINRRSKGRLGNSTLDEETKSPIILAPNTHQARLIIQEAHGTYHRGVEHTISTVRQCYWIPKIRQHVRKIVNRFVKFRRINGHPFPYPSTTDLPERRVARSHPFQHVGIDFFDLPTTSDCTGSTRPYGCIFTLHAYFIWRSWRAQLQSIS